MFIMEITWFGAASLRLSFEEKSVLIDPFFPLSLNGFEREALLKTYRKEKHILFTHNHFDHVGNAAEIAQNNPCALYATKSVVRSLGKKGLSPDRFSCVRAGEQRHIEHFSVRFSQGRHVRFGFSEVMQAAKNGLAHPVMLSKVLMSNRAYDKPNGAKEIVFLDIQAGGKHVQVMSSLGLDPETKYATGADALIFAYAGSTRLIEISETLISKLKPKRVIPYHFDNAFPPLTQEPDLLPLLNMMSDRFPQTELYFPKIGIPFTV